MNDLLENQWQGNEGTQTAQLGDYMLEIEHTKYDEWFARWWRKTDGHVHRDFGTARLTNEDMKTAKSEGLQAFSAWVIQKSKEILDATESLKGGDS